MFKRFKPYRLFEAEGVGGSGGTQQPPQGQQQPQGGAQAQQQSAQAQQDAFDLNSMNIWAPAQQPAAQQTPAPQQQVQQQPDTLAQFDQYVKNLNFGKFELDADSLQKFVQHGDMQGFNTALSGMMQGAYKQMMLDASKMMGNMREQIVEEALNKAKSMYGAARTFDDLVAEVPLAKNPNVKPIAEAVYKQFRNQGGDHAAAVKGVKNFLGAMRQVKETDIGLPPRTTQPGMRRGDNYQDALETEEAIDWVAFSNGNS